MDSRTDQVDITGTTVLAYGTVLDVGSKQIISHGHCWSKEPEPTIEDFNSDLGVPGGTGDFYSRLTNLSPGIVHYVKSYLYDGKEYSYGEVVSFEITAEDIEFTSVEISKIDIGVIHANSLTNGVGSVSFEDHGHCWSQVDPPTINDNKTAFGPYQSDMSFTSQLNNLTKGRYYIRGYLESEGTVVYTNTIVYESEIAIETGLVSNRSFGKINSFGVNAIVNHGHCWSDTTSTPDFNSKHSSFGPVSQLGSFYTDLTELKSGRRYYVRAYATDNSKVYYGEIKSFVVQ